MRIEFNYALESAIIDLLKALTIYIKERTLGNG
jgi:hypothetical protein